jgi:hypothetical protein
MTTAFPHTGPIISGALTDVGEKTIKNNMLYECFFCEFSRRLLPPVNIHRSSAFTRKKR